MMTDFPATPISDVASERMLRHSHRALVGTHCADRFSPTDPKAILMP